MKELDVLRRGVIDWVTEKELKDKLASGRKLRVKLGVDPTSPDIHLGHTVPLRKLRQFQEMGHQVVLIIGDYTAMVGDPTGRSVTRPRLSHEEVLANAATYQEQAFCILDPEKTEVVFNGDWFSKMTFHEVSELASRFTVARMLERDDFSKRYKAGQPISIHEFMYPLMQGWDSVVIRADVELGGTDQTFNILVGRDLQREMGMEPQVALFLPILPGTDGVQKMSKSLGNYIGVKEPAGEIYGKVMSIPDEVMMVYYELVTDVPMEEIEAFKRGLEDGSVHPRDLKRRLARELVTIYHSEAEAHEAEASFDAVFAQGKLPDEMPEFSVGDLSEVGKLWVVKLMVETGLAQTNGEARRLITQGGVKINGEKVDSVDAEVVLTPGMVIQVGKRKYARLI